MAAGEPYGLRVRRAEQQNGAPAISRDEQTYELYAVRCEARRAGLFEPHEIGKRNWCVEAELADDIGKTARCLHGACARHHRIDIVHDGLSRRRA